MIKQIDITRYELGVPVKEPRAKPAAKVVHGGFLLVKPGECVKARCPGPLIALWVVFINVSAPHHDNS